MLDYMMNLKFSNDFWLFVVPVVLMLIDIITGYYNAYEHNEVSSSKMRDGLGKKVAELCYILIGVIFAFAFDTKIIAYFISIYISYMELVSVNENCKKLGVALPADITSSMKKYENNVKSTQTHEDTDTDKKDSNE